MLAVAIPLAAAAVVAAVGRWVPRTLVDLASIAAAAASTSLTAVLLARVHAAPGHRVIAWAGGWTPHGPPGRGSSVGIVLAVDQLGATLALLSAGLVLLMLVYSWRFFEVEGAAYHALVLVLAAGLVGFACTGDLFTLFVFFELTGTAGYALTGYLVQQDQPSQGALTFGVTTTVAGLFVLTGLCLLYARTSALGMAPIGRELATRPPDVLVVTAFVLVVGGLLVKAASVPFHFWTADAEAVAPTPVCVLLSCSLVALASLGIARVYWTVFSGALPPSSVRGPLIAVGAVTALVGAVMSVLQHHLKRMLAFATVAHGGLFIAGVGAVSADGLAGATVDALGHAGVEGALFLLVGIVLDRYASISEPVLHGQARELQVTGAFVIIGGLGLAGCPPFGTGLGKAVTEHAAGASWMPVVGVATGALTGSAVLRMWARVFRGWGEPADEDQSSRNSDEPGDDERETTGPVSGDRVALTMFVPAVLLLVGALALGSWPGATAWAARGAEVVMDRTGFASQVLDGVVRPVASQGHVEGWTPEGVVTGLLASLLAVVIAAAAVRGVGRVVQTRAAGPVRVLRQVHSGHVGDYIAWQLAGVAVLGGALVLTAL